MNQQSPSEINFNNSVFIELHHSLTIIRSHLEQREEEANREGTVIPRDHGEKRGSNLSMKYRDTIGSTQGLRIHSLNDWRIQCHIGVGWGKTGK